jgi:16S rRNA (adenine1518-N6/adenine1519-N6)-dimethyltransferase
MSNLDSILMSGTIEFDQHFMTDSALIKRISAYAQLKNSDVVLEIGAGHGELTKELVKSAKSVISYEVDSKLHKNLALLSKKHTNLHVFNEDFLDAQLPKFNKVVANIPYSISEQIFTKLMNYDFEVAVLTVGEKFAQLLSGSGEGRISIIAPVFYKVVIKEAVPKSSFKPAPKVRSSVVAIYPREKSDIVDYRQYVIRELWEQQTMKTKNALVEGIIHYASSRSEKLTKREARECVDALGIDAATLEKTVRRLSGNELVQLQKIL